MINLGLSTVAAGTTPADRLAAALAAIFNVSKQAATMRLETLRVVVSSSHGWFHRLANIRAKLPDEIAGEILAHVYAVPTLDAARAAADRFTNSFARDYPSAVACFTDDLDALLAIHRVPAPYRAQWAAARIGSSCSMTVWTNLRLSEFSRSSRVG